MGQPEPLVKVIAAGVGQTRRHQPTLHPASCWSGLLEPTAGRGNLARPATGRAYRDASDRARPAARLGRTAQASHYVIHKSWNTPAVFITSACASWRWSAPPQGGTASIPVRENTPERAGWRSAHPVSRPHPCAERRESAGLFARSPVVHWRKRTRRWREMDSNFRFRAR